MILVSFYRTTPEHRYRIRTQDPGVLCSNPVIKGLDNYAELIGPPVIANLSTLMSGVILFLFSLGKRISRFVKA